MDIYEVIERVLDENAELAAKAYYNDPRLVGALIGKAMEMQSGSPKAYDKGIREALDERYYDPDIAIDGKAIKSVEIGDTIISSIGSLKVDKITRDVSLDLVNASYVKKLEKRIKELEADMNAIIEHSKRDYDYSSVGNELLRRRGSQLTKSRHGLTLKSSKTPSSDSFEELAKQMFEE